MKKIDNMSSCRKEHRNIAEIYKNLENDVKMGKLSKKSEEDVRSLMEGIIVKVPLLIPPEAKTVKNKYYSGSVYPSTTLVDSIPYVCFYNKKGKVQYYLEVVSTDRKALKIPLKSLSDVKKLRDEFGFNIVEEKFKEFVKDALNAFWLSPLNAFETNNKKILKAVKLLETLIEDKNTMVYTTDTTYITPCFTWNNIENIKNVDDFLQKNRNVRARFDVVNIREMHDKNNQYQVVLKHTIVNNKRKIELLESRTIEEGLER